MNKKAEVRWDKKASNRLNAEYKRIQKDSLKNADIVRDAIIGITRKLPDNPERYKRDPLKKNNPGNYRVFESHSLRVSYLHTEEEIIILRVRHVKQKPLMY